MKADQRWEMRATREEKKIMNRAAKRLQLTQAGLVKMLIRVADELTREEEKPSQEQRAAAA